jgi:hypothetical protein
MAHHGTSSRTEHLLALMKKGDDAFNARDFATVDSVHHPDMVAHITGNLAPIYGREAHAAAMAQLILMFPDMAREQRSLPDPVRHRRLDHRGHQRHRNLPGRDGPARWQGGRPDRKSVRCRVRPNHPVAQRSTDRDLRLLGCLFS